MNFISFTFLLFFAVVIIILQLIPHRFSWAVLLCSSLYFYGCFDPMFIIVLLIPSTGVYLIALHMGSNITESSRYRWFIVGILIVLSPLLYFKYALFILDSLSWLTSKFFLWEISGLKDSLPLIWPVGISFFCFRLISYLTDVYRKSIKPESHYGFFTLYVSFFPMILAGPIDRARDLLPQLKRRVHFDPKRMADGMVLFTIGVVKKTVISDRIGIIVNELFRNPGEYSGISLIIGAYLYAIQIYADFSGYTDMAIGLSKILGYQPAKNFDFPYFSKSVKEFWNRWHISLSHWLRDYLFLPSAYYCLSKFDPQKTYRFKSESWAYIFGTGITMLLGGLWHGASWTMVVWGGLHALFLIFAYLTQKKRRSVRKYLSKHLGRTVTRIISMWVTFQFVSFAWIFFRASSIENALNYIGRMGFSAINKGKGYLMFSVVLAGIFIACEIIVKQMKSKNIMVPLYFKVFAFAFIVCIIFIFSVDSKNEFIYFRF